MEFLQTHPEYREKLAEMLSPTQFVKRDELTELLEEIKQLRIESNQRFETLQEQMDKRFEQVDKRFEALIAEMNKRFEQVDKRFEQVNKRFEQGDYKFDKVFQRLDDMSTAFGHDFEEFNSLWLQEYLIAQGYPKLTIKKRTFVDQNYEVFPDSTDVEVDVYNEEPLVIGEVTAITRNIAKITIFMRKVQFLKKMKGKEPKVFCVTYGFHPKIRDEALRLLEEARVKVFTLRQRDMNALE